MGKWHSAAALFAVTACGSGATTRQDVCAALHTPLAAEADVEIDDTLIRSADGSPFFISHPPCPTIGAIEVDWASIESASGGNVLQRLLERVRTVTTEPRQIGVQARFRGKLRKQGNGLALRLLAVRDARIADASAQYGAMEAEMNKPPRDPASGH